MYVMYVYMHKLIVDRRDKYVGGRVEMKMVNSRYGGYTVDVYIQFSDGSKGGGGG